MVKDVEKLGAGCLFCPDFEHDFFLFLKKSYLKAIICRLKLLLPGGEIQNISAGKD